MYRSPYLSDDKQMLSKMEKSWEILKPKEATGPSATVEPETPGVAYQVWSQHVPYCWKYATSEDDRNQVISGSMTWFLGLDGEKTCSQACQG